MNKQNPDTRAAGLQPILEARGLCKTYRQGLQAIEVLQDISLTLQRGDTMAVVGASGSGKSTLLNILGTLDGADAGTLKILGQETTGASDAALVRLRNEHIGFVYQFHHLLPEFTALENVMMPLLLRREARAEAQDRAGDMLERVGLAQRMTHEPAQLSGGERQRVAIARALVTRPSLLFMDEPTGNLDSRSAAVVQGLLDELVQEQNAGVILVTHDMTLAERMQRRFMLNAGVLRQVV